MSKYCPSCGEELIDDAKFCKSCGENLKNSNTGQTTENTTHDDVAVGQAVPPPGLDPAVDGHVPALDGDADLAAVLHEAGELEELAELDRPVDADRAQ